MQFPKAKPKDLSKWSTWYSDAVGFAKDEGLARVPKTAYRELFNAKVSPRDAAKTLASAGRGDRKD